MPSQTEPRWFEPSHVGSEPALEFAKPGLPHLQEGCRWHLATAADP